MGLSSKTLKLIAEYIKKASELELVTSKLSKSLEADTDGVFSICTQTPDKVQFYYDGLHRGDVAPIKAVKEIVDNAELSIRWEDDDQCCFSFKVDGQPCIIVLDKEKMAN